jgi:hypothetical protein
MRNNSIPRITRILVFILRLSRINYLPVPR